MRIVSGSKEGTKSVYKLAFLEACHFYLYGMDWAGHTDRWIGR